MPWPSLWLLALSLEILLGVLALRLSGQTGPAVVAVIANLAVTLRFALTLLPGRVPLITRYARCDYAGLPPHAEPYTRGLTVFWCAILAGFAFLHGMVMAGWSSTEALSVLQSAICLGLFTAEHALRTLHLPELGLATPWRTFRAIIAHHAA